GLGLALLVARKARAFASACAARGVRARSLLPLATGPRAALAGAALAAGVGLQAYGLLTAGASLVALAVLAAASRAPAGPLPPRGPGRWLVLKPADAFAPEAGGSWLDGSSAAGRKAVCAALASVAAAAFLARRFGAEAPWLVM